MPQINLPSYFKIGAAMALFQPVLVWLWTLAEPVRNLFNAIIGDITINGINTSLGAKVVSALSGTFEFLSGTPDIIIIAIGGGLAALIGKWVYDQKWSPDAKTKLGEVTFVLFYASIALVIAGNVLGGGELPTLKLIALFGVNATISAWFIVRVLSERLNIIKV